MNIVSILISIYRLSTLIISPSRFLVHLPLFHAEPKLLPTPSSFQFHTSFSYAISLRKLSHESVKVLPIPSSGGSGALSLQLFPCLFCLRSLFFLLRNLLKSIPSWKQKTKQNKNSHWCCTTFQILLLTVHTDFHSGWLVSWLVYNLNFELS